MPAVSKAQQRFFGMVRATQKGEMENPSSEVAQAASSMSKSDVKKFAKTKHDKLPEKKEVKESGDYWHPDPKKDAQISGQGNKQRAREDRGGSSKPAAKSDPKKLRKGESYMDYAKRQRGSSAPKPKERKRDKIGKALGRAIDRIGGLKKEETVHEGIGLEVAKAIDKTKPPLGRPSVRRSISQALKMREVDKSSKKKRTFKHADKKSFKDFTKEVEASKNKK
tara:strand:+ start:3136 stop:3804 length:669 start_codon:yes stop_codon:yes gene_type:complete